MKGSRLALALGAPALALALAVAVSTVVLLISGHSPGEVYSVMWHYATTTRSVILTLNRAAPYYVSGVAVAIGFKMNLFNIGVEGQYRLAALLAAAAGAAITIPAPLHILFILAVAMAVGAGWAAIAGVLKATRGVSEVISTIMLNAIALGLTAFMLTRWVKGPKTGSTDYSVGTRPIASSGHLPHLDRLLTGLGIDIPQGASLQSFIVLAAIVGVGYWVLVWRTRFGYDLRATGTNPTAAQASGVSPKRMIITTMAVSGAIAGLVGLSRMLSESPFRYTDELVFSGLGFTGIAVALLGRNHPVGIAFAALLWAQMDILQTPLARADLPQEIITIMQGTIVLSVVVAYEVTRRVAQRREASAVATEGDGGQPVAAPPPSPPPSSPPSPVGVGA